MSTATNQILHVAWTFLCGNYSDDSKGCSHGQLLIGSFITTTHPLMHHIFCSFLGKHQITQVTHTPYNPNLAPWNFRLFPKLKSPLKGRRFQNVVEIQENTMGQLMVMGELYEVPNLKELRCHCSIYNVFCILYLLQNMYLFFIVHGWIPSGHTSYSIYKNFPAFILHTKC